MTIKENNEVGQAQMPEAAPDLTCYTYFLLDKLTQDEITAIKTKFENIYKKAIRNLFVDGLKKQKTVNFSAAPVKDCLVKHVDDKIFLIYPIVYECIFDEIYQSAFNVLKNEYPHIFPLDYCFWVGKERSHLHYLRLYHPNSNQEPV